MLTQWVAPKMLNRRFHFRQGVIGSVGATDVYLRLSWLKVRSNLGWQHCGSSNVVRLWVELISALAYPEFWLYSRGTHQTLHALVADRVLKREQCMDGRPGLRCKLGILLIANRGGWVSEFF
jgi:hypothetical protein